MKYFLYDNNLKTGEKFVIPDLVKSNKTGLNICYSLMENNLFCLIRNVPYMSLSIH